MAARCLPLNPRPAPAIFTTMRAPLRVIQRKMAAGEYVVSVHFAEAMKDDAIFFADILAAMDGATRAISNGFDAQGDPKYRGPGQALDGRRLEVVCRSFSSPCMC